MQTGNAETLRERVCVQTDKPLYLSGELLWMKMFTTDADGKPLDLSKVGYVELLDEAIPRVQAKLELKDGVGEGSVVLPVSLPTGNYRLVAYTRYMQNEGEVVYFNKVIPVVNTFGMDNTVTLSEDTLAVQPGSFRAISNKITVSPDNTTYQTRSAGEIRLENIPSDIHTLSVSIAGRESMAEYSSTGIQQWEQQMDGYPQPSFDVKLTPEMEGHVLRGKLIDLSTNEPAKLDGYVPVTLLGFVGNRIRIFSGQVDVRDASVAFYTKHVSGTHEIATTAITPLVEKYRVDIQSPFITHTDRQLPAIEWNPAWNRELLKRSMGLQVLQSYRGDSLSVIKGVDALLQWKPDWRYLLDEYTRFATMGEVVTEFIPGLRFKRIGDRRVLSVLTEERTGYTDDNSLVLLDGIPVADHELLYNYNPLLIEEICIYRGKYQFGGVQFDGIATFKTYGNDYQELTVSNATQLFDYEGTQAPRYFYTPSYATEQEKNTRMPDYRHTLLWEPRVKTEGNAAVIPFTTSDLKGEYVVTVEGLTKNGEAISGTSLIKVE
jgi:hypothetical protein